MLKSARRMLAILLALTFVTGLMPHGMRAADAGVTMAMAATDMPMSGMCAACGDDQKAMMSAVCTLYCGNAIALPAVQNVFEAGSVERFGTLPEPSMAGYTVTPDPSPPRPAVNS